MAGHSHSANIRFRKDRVDAKRAKTFSKLARMITVAAKMGGGDPDANPRLRLALEKARVASMPKENIERAIKKGVGDTDLDAYEELVYEGYGPGGVAVMLEILTDNRNRTAPELRKLFERAGGNLGSAGSVAYLFERKAAFTVAEDAGLDEDRLTEIALEAGAEDLLEEDGVFQILGEPAQYEDIARFLDRAGVRLASSGVEFVPGMRAEVAEVGDARRVLRLLDSLEDHDDVQNVYANPRIPAAVAEQLASDG